MKKFRTPKDLKVLIIKSHNRLFKLYLAFGVSALQAGFSRGWFGYFCGRGIFRDFWCTELFSLNAQAFNVLRGTLRNYAELFLFFLELGGSPLLRSGRGTWRNVSPYRGIDMCGMIRAYAEIPLRGMMATWIGEIPCAYPLRGMITPTGFDTIRDAFRYVPWHERSKGFRQVQKKKKVPRSSAKFRVKH